MDPYKVLGIPEASIRKPSDLEKVRAKTKILFKRYREEKNKFELKKCMEAFELIKRKVKKNNIGDENCKILGRSRKEREMDKHFNHQSKEIKNNKEFRKELKLRKQSSKAKYQLPGENKERISRRKIARADRKRKHAEKKKKRKRISMDIIEGLRRITGHMIKKEKFYKCMEMLYRWIKEYMTRENRQYVFIALSNAIETGHLTHDKDTRNIVVSMYEYVLGYYDYWFTEDCRNSRDRKELQAVWKTAAILRVHCYTDDAFILQDTIGKLTEVMKSIEETSLAPLNEDDDIKTEDKIGLKEEDASPNFSDAEAEEAIRQSLIGNEHANGADDDDDDDMAAMFGGFAGDDDPEPSPPPLASPSPEADDVKTKVNGDKVAKEEPMKKEPVESKEEKAAKKAKKEEVKKEKQAKVIKAEIIDSDDEIEIKSESDGEQPVKQEEDLISCSSDESEHTLSSDDEESDGGVEFVKMDDREETIFRTPTHVVSYNKLRHHFTECLGTLMTIRWNLWARTKIDTFFQEVYYKKDFFSEDQATKIEAWQAKIKAGHQGKEQVLGEANIPLESKNPVVDARSEISLAGHGNSVWANKQFGLA